MYVKTNVNIVVRIYDDEGNEGDHDDNNDGNNDGDDAWTGAADKILISKKFDLHGFLNC